MKKMPCLFERDFHGKVSFTLRLDVTPGCEWVLEGLGTASIKRDGTACMIQGGKLYARYDAKAGKTPPPGAIPCDDAPDPVTGHWPHWVLVEEQPQFKWHREAWERTSSMIREDQGREPVASDYMDGTYELVGPKVSANAEGFDHHRFIRHGSESLFTLPRSYAGLAEWLLGNPYEGVVFLHPDGVTRCKIRRADFGYAWPIGKPRNGAPATEAPVVVATCWCGWKPPKNLKIEVLGVVSKVTFECPDCGRTLEKLMKGGA